MMNRIILVSAYYNIEGILLLKYAYKKWHLELYYKINYILQLLIKHTTY